MQFESLKIFCDVVRTASFSRGAVENGISQSSASQAVQHLEERLGLKLIDRSKRPLVLTQAGRVYYDGCLRHIEPRRPIRFFERRTVMLMGGKSAHLPNVSVLGFGTRGACGFLRSFFLDSPVEHELYLFVL